MTVYAFLKAARWRMEKASYISQIKKTPNFMFPIEKNLSSVSHKMTPMLCLVALSFSPDKFNLELEHKIEASPTIKAAK